MTNLTTYGVLEAITTTGYDGQGRAVSQTDALGNSVETTYDSLGQTLTLLGATYPVCYAYDTAGHQYACNHDILGRVTNAYDSLSVVSAFLYNTRSEVINAVVGTNTTAYLYNSIGGRIFSSKNSESTAYTANNLNQYTQISVPSAPLREPLYDADGNMLTDSNSAYTWDAENRMTSAMPLNPVEGTKRLLFRYDWKHRVTQFNIESYHSLAWVPHETRTFIWDGWLLSSEVVERADNTKQTLEYFWGNDLSGSEQGAGGVGGLIAVSVDGFYHLPCYDHNGNITAYISESGTLSAQYRYDAFGNTLEQSGSLSDTFRHRFSTKYFIPELHAYYYGYRLYLPRSGCWFNRDPIEEKGGLNLYGFVCNNPMNKIDCFGLILWNGCCNGKEYNKILHCCQKGTIWSRFEEIPTGVKVCVASAQNWGLVDHKWLETAYGNIGVTPSGNMFGSVGSNITTDSYVALEDKKCVEVTVAPCQYDVEKFLEVFSLQIGMYNNTPSAWWYAIGISDCRHFVDSVINYAKNKSKY